MRLKISHMTEYSYGEPVEFALQRLRLTPQDGPGQQVLNWQTSVTGAGREAAYKDHFGNHVELVSIRDGSWSISEREGSRIEECGGRAALRQAPPLVQPAEEEAARRLAAREHPRYGARFDQVAALQPPRRALSACVP